LSFGEVVGCENNWSYKVSFPSSCKEPAIKQSNEVNKIGVIGILGIVSSDKAKYRTCTHELEILIQC
jgi:hypothetical protein